MFYGYYSNITIETNHPAGNAVTQLVPYSIPTAYFFTITVSFFIICILLVYRFVNNSVILTYLIFIHLLCLSNGISPYSMSKSFGRSFRVFKPHGNLSEKVFCFWDFKVSKKSSIRLQSEKISTQLKVRKYFSYKMNNLSG